MQVLEPNGNQNASVTWWCPKWLTATCWWPNWAKLDLVKVHASRHLLLTLQYKCLFWLALKQICLLGINWYREMLLKAFQLLSIIYKICEYHKKWSQTVSRRAFWRFWMWSSHPVDAVFQIFFWPMTIYMKKSVRRDLVFIHIWPTLQPS